MTDYQQQSPDGAGLMDSVVFKNPDILSVDIAIFDDNQFKSALNGRDEKHCEGCLYPTLQDPVSWVVFVEIKDCKPYKLVVYKKEVKRQIYNSVRAFRKRKILTREKVYGLISFPRCSLDFNDTIFADQIEIRRLKRFTGINYWAANAALILDDQHIRLSEE